MKCSLGRSAWAMILGLFVSVLPLQLATAQAPKGKPFTVRGKISAVEGLSLKVATAAGEVLVRFAEDVRIGGVAAAQLSDITAGSYVG
ncbi:MAG TPA: hypothetical protein VK603_23535, partial [Candidatus Saccharimonadales bacterium]|nr:hypothetical protein [Candidatus Saccharimonadales bacterium]